MLDTLPAGVLADEIETEGAERIRALIVIAGDPLRSVPGAARLARAFERLEALVTVDMFESETGRRADLILPTTSWLERGDLAIPGLPLQTVPLLQTTGAVRPRPGEVRGELEVLAGLSLALGRPLLGSAPLARALARMPLDRAIQPLARLLGSDYGLPVPTPEPGSYLGRGPMTPGNRVRFWHPALEAEVERLHAHERRLTEQEGFVLIGRRRRIGHNSWIQRAGRQTDRETTAWVAPEDLPRLGLAEGEGLRVARGGEAITLPVQAKEGVQPGTIVVPHGALDVNINALLPAGADHIEPLSGQLIMTGVPAQVAAARSDHAPDPLLGLGEDSRGALAGVDARGG